MLIDKSNYQTVVLERAIESLTNFQKGKRNQIDEFDVRHELDRLRAATNVTVGWKVNPDDPSRNDPVVKKASDLWQYSESSIQTVLAKVKENYSKDLTRFQFPVQEGGKKELIEIVDNLRQTAFMIKSTDVKKFVLAILETAEYVQTMDYKNSAQKINILFSPVKGGGKSHFLEHLKDDAEKAGVFTGWGALPSRGDTNDDFHPFMENALVIAQDAQEKEYYESGIMAIGRKENLQIKEKYGKPYTARMLADVWTSTNNFLRSDRTKNIIECNSFRIEDVYEKFYEKFMRNSDSISLCNIWNYSFSHNSHNFHLKEFLGNKFSKKCSGGENEIYEILRGIPDCAFLLSTIEEVRDAPIDFKSVSVSRIVKYADFKKDDEKRVKPRLSRIIKNLFGKGIVTRTVSGSIEYEQWDLTKIKDITPEQVFTGEKDNADIMDEIEKTQQAYYEIIDWIKGNYDPDPKKEEKESFLKEDESKQLDDSWTVCTRFDKDTFDKSGDQVVVNKPLDKPSRKNDEVHKQNYLMECDDISIEEQKDIIEELPKEVKDSIYWVCKTGGKSIHTVIATNTPDEADSGMRKFIHQKLNETYFKNHADPSGQNAARLARAPNCIRQDDKHYGEFQTCLHFNMNPNPLDVSAWVEEYKDKERARVLFDFSKPYTGPKEFQCNTLEQLEEWNRKHPTKMKEECIKFLTGKLEDWNRGIACVRALRNYGFSDEDIRAESCDNDKWVKEALKGAK